MTPHKSYGLLGRKLKHSFSKDYFNRKFEAEGIDAEYINFEIDDINQIMEVLSQYNTLSGLNVTIPYKEEVMQYLDEIDEHASRIGAVNVIQIINKGNDIRLKGYNTDFIGFRYSIAGMLTPAHDKALILGTGGAAKAVAYGLRSLGVESQFVSRRKSASTLVYEELTKATIQSHKIIVNTTPLGMYPDVASCPDIPYRFITRSHVCYDLIYNPDETKFLQNSRQMGASVKNGLEMLLIQAFKSYEIWNS